MSENTACILVVDDEKRIRSLLKMYLLKESYSVEEAEDGDSALRLATRNDFDLILLDLMLPGLNGIELCLRLRQVKSTPVIMLTAKSEEMNRAQGFEVGADDYVVKPFSPREVIYRVKAILRRASGSAFSAKLERSSNNIIFPNLVIEHTAHRVMADNQEVRLTPKEYDLIRYLALSPEKVFSREELLKSVWNYDFFSDPRTVDTHIKRLREKLNRVSADAANMITTVGGIGYIFKVPKCWSSDRANVDRKSVHR